MNAGVRVVLAIAFVGGLVLVGSVVFGGDDRKSGTVPEGTRWTSSEQCKGCHVGVYVDWKGSHHQIAYQNPEVRKLSDDFRNKECQACHLPQPVALTGFGNRVLPRMTQPDEGVSCLSCHLAADGTIMGSRDLDVGCRPRRNEGFLSVDMCASCHNQHQTTDQFLASRYAKDNGHCNDCHMPKVRRREFGASEASTPRETRGTGRLHGFLAAHHKGTLQEAGEFRATVEGGELVLKLTNVGAGHNFPTEERHRAVDMVYRFVDGSGNASAWTRAYRFRSPYRDEPGENTQLPAGESHTERVAIPEGTKTAQARLWYRLMPHATDEDPASTLLFEREISIE